MGEKLNIKNLKELVSLGAGLYKGVEAAKADGKISVEDVGALLPIVPLIVPALENINMIVPELADLSVTEKDELVSHLKAEMPELASDLAAFEKVSACLSLAVAVKDVYTAFAKGAKAHA